MPSPRKRRRGLRYSTMSNEARASALINTTGPLLEMFAVLDAVFTEDDALDPAKRQMTVGRCYEQWKRTRAALDPDFDPDDRPRRRIGGGPSILHPDS